MENYISENSLAAIENNINDEVDDVFVFPASFAQQRLWFLEELQVGVSTYNIPFALRLTGSLHIPALEQAIAEIIRRHEVLRTSFKMLNGNLLQVINLTHNYDLSLVDLRLLAESQQTSEVQRLADIEAQQPFDLAIAPLVRVKLLVLGLESHVLLVTMHHIISDGWSTSIFINEVAALYRAFIESKPSPLPELTIQYADFAAWQREWLSGQLETQLNYWQKQLQGIPPLLELPTDRPRKAIQTYNGSTQSFELDIQLTQKLEYLSQNCGATLFMTLLAAFVVLLARYSGQQDIVIGSPIANRNRQEIEQLIGFFVNTLVLRTTVDDNPTFSQLLQRVKQTALDAYAHQDLPFEQLVEALQPERSLSYSPLFQVLFVLQNTPSLRLELPDLTLTPIASTRHESKFDLTLSIEQTPTGLIGEWEYNTDLFDATTIERLSGHFQTLLSAIVSNPDETVFELPLLTGTEWQQLIVEANQTYTEYGDAECLHKLFEKQVVLTPDAIAVVFEDQSLTYRQLNQRANQLAHYLQSKGVKPDVLVGICIERSLLMIIGLLAILKAGGAYVPIDPNYPLERLAFMFEDTQVPVLLTQQRLIEKLVVEQAEVICLDTQWDAIAVMSDTNPDSEVKLNNLIYVIYTSGSTGKPKGIALPHLALTNLLQWHLMTLKKGVSVLQFASLSFDASIHEIFAAWCSGGTIFIISDSSRLDLKELIHFLAENSIQKVILPVVVFQQLAEIYGEQKHLFKNLKEIITTGEQLQINKPIVNLFNKLEDCSLHNHYGPSETHVVTAFTFPESPNDWPVYPPIGKPIANTQAYILDAYMQPVPVGVIGELYFGGDGLARGYLNRDELTSQKFIPNPFNNGANILYKTGDLARYLADGNIEYVGRIDHQVKIRGFRVELGEIEAFLNQYPQINQSIVTVKNSKQGERRLVSYIVPVKGKTINSLELREFLLKKLPEYMVPVAFIILDTFPLTPTAKVDRNALPEPDDNSYILSTSFVAPSTPAEEVLVQIWSELLGVKKIGIYDNFFYLGGHSLLATQLISRIRQTFYVEIPLRSLFESSTVADLVQVMAKIAGSRELIDEIASTLKEINQLSPEELQNSLAQLKESI